MNKPAAHATPLVQAEEITRKFSAGRNEVYALNGINLQVKPGETLAVTGPSGAGKSTLLHIIGLMDRPTGGLLSFDGEQAGRMPENRRAALRRENIGFVFQFENLIEELTVEENVALPLEMAGMTKPEASGEARKILESLGLAARARHRPSELSGGEQQRAAIARALVRKPRLVLADEPTGNLDTKTAAQVMNVFSALQKKRGFTLIIATHQDAVARKCGRTVLIVDGKVK